MEALSRKIEAHFVDFRAGYDKIVARQAERPDFYIFEPKTFGEKLECLRQNTIEITVVLAVMIAALYSPSVFALAEILCTMPLLLTSLLAPVAITRAKDAAGKDKKDIAVPRSARIRYGIGSQVFAIVVLISMIVCKVLILTHAPADSNEATVDMCEPTSITKQLE